MGYDIIGGHSKKEIFVYDNDLIHIQCQYAYQKHFREAFGCEITEWNGKLHKKDIPSFLNGLDRFINMLEVGLDVPMYIGNLSNINSDEFIKELKELRKLVESRQIQYLSIG